MPWREFLIANAAGAVLWASAFGSGGYFFGKLLLQLHHSLAMVVFVVALVAFLGAGYLINRYEYRLIEAAERTLPGPLETMVAKKIVPPTG
jgi:membrane protein DedA with SNARE-associated domain